MNHTMCSCRTRASYVVPRLLNALAEARAILSAPLSHFSYLHASIVQHTMAAPKRKGFDPKAGSMATPRPAATKIPKVEAIQIGPAWHAPPAEMARKMGDGSSASTSKMQGGRSRSGTRAHAGNSASAISVRSLTSSPAFASSAGHSVLRTKLKS